MARPLRINIADGWYHVMSRGLDRCAIFEDARDHKHFLELLGEMVGRYSVRLHVYVLMGNHYHLLVQTPHANLSRAMQWLNVSYGVWFNLRHDRVGPLFQGRWETRTEGGATGNIATADAGIGQGAVNGTAHAPLEFLSGLCRVPSQAAGVVDL